MSAVIGMSDVLGQTTLSAEQQHYVATISKSGTAFLDIINGLLDLTMIESGRFIPRDRGFELHAVVEAMLDMLAYRVCQRGLELLSLVDEDVPGWLRGDALALRQILLYLLAHRAGIHRVGGAGAGQAQQGYCRRTLHHRAHGQIPRQGPVHQTAGPEPHAGGTGRCRARAGQYLTGRCPSQVPSRHTIIDTGQAVVGAS